MRAALICAMMTSCALFPSLDGLSGGDAGPDADAAVATDGPSEQPAADARGDAPMSDAVSDAPAGDGGCPSTGGPTPVSAGGVCVDSTEVTNGEYKQFLAASFGATPPPGCSWKTSNVPGSWPPSVGTDSYPVAYVDWCDAYAFCQWAGKRLCGRIGGGAIAPGSAFDPSQDQWTAACSHAGDGQHAYPYGNTFSPSACNGPERDAGAALPVGSLATCTGGYASIVDMVGNVYEWEDGCNASTGASDTCNQRSGSFTDPAGVTQTCAYARPVARNFRDNDIGFRCCGP